MAQIGLYGGAACKREIDRKNGKKHRTHGRESNGRA
jgi:hypothetical protein